MKPLLFALLAVSALAQNQRTTGTIMVWAAPSGVCLAKSPMEYYSAGNQYWGCVLPTITSLTGTWTQVSGGGGGGATIPATTNIIKGDGAGNGADSGYVAQNATTSLTGFLTSTDWNTFNNKQAALGFTAVPNSRLINTTSPITGGGDLTADRTFACATCTVTIASGAKTLNTTAVSANTCGTVQTDTATGTLTTDSFTWVTNGDITAVTGYNVAGTFGLEIFAYPTADLVNFKVCNTATFSITPGAVTINWAVRR